MKPTNRAAGVGFAGFVLLALAASAGAQINAAPPSVTSLGFGGRAINGTPPSVTSLGPHGYTPGFNPAFPNSNTYFGSNPFSNGHHHHQNAYGVIYAVPYSYGYYDNGDDPNAPPDEQYNGGPTVFDRRGSGSAARPPAAADVDEDAALPVASVTGQRDDPPAKDQPQTVLVFKDGHQLEVENYAIVGSTLYDLTDGHRRKIALSDLDLDATTKQNDDRGVDFQVPPGS